MNKESKTIFESYFKGVVKKILNETHSCECGCGECGPGCPCDAACECKNKVNEMACGHREDENCECFKGRQYIDAEIDKATGKPKVGGAADIIIPPEIQKGPMPSFPERASAAADLIKLINAVRTGDQAIIQQISNKYQR
jgi:hypothetical protein